MADSKQKVIERNRAPRVQIAYDVEHYGSPTTIELPFVMGVMADLAGASETPEAKKPVNDRTFVETDAGRFNKFMEALSPRVKASVPNRLPLDETGREEAFATIDAELQKDPDIDPAAAEKARAPIYNIAAQQKRDVAEVAAEVVGLLKDPAAALGKMKDYEVNPPRDISEKIEKMSGTPQHGQAQRYLVDLLETEYSDRMSIDLSFRTMSDFAPDKVAEQIEPLAELLRMRRQLEELLSYMDGKVDAEKRIAALLQDQPLLAKVAGEAMSSTKDEES